MYSIWGLAALDAYNTYKDSEFLGYAISMWTQLHRYMITSSQATVEPATHPTRTVNFAGVCNGVSNAGAVFYVRINSIAHYGHYLNCVTKMSGTSGDTRVDGQTITYADYDSFTPTMQRLQSSQGVHGVSYLSRTYITAPSLT